MEIRTCEQYVLNELEAERAENALLRKKIKELESAAAEREAKMGESPNGEIEPRQVQMVRINEPFETAYLTVKDYYDFRGKDNGLGLTVDEIREKASSREGLIEIANKRVGWSNVPAMSVEINLWPCQLRTGMQTFVIDLYNHGRSISEARVCKDDEKSCNNKYYPSYRADELFELGLEMLKNNLLEYADKLDAEADKEAENEHQA